MTITLAELSRRTGLSVLDHLEDQLEIPVMDGLQAQGDLLIVPHAAVAVAVTLPVHPWREVPPAGVVLLRGAAGGNPHTLVADRGTCTWTTDVRDSFGLALGALRATGPVYLLHPEHGATGLTPGTYVVRRQREIGHRPPSRGFTGGGHRLVAD
ncbi:hypothetical protein [Actinocorallia longicatena]|uniref:Uncharacterized protein n=1 Tax=Actinocorallia longicatena TaxID=111803 RepID=A0ABP6Q950_9ACTN